MSNSQPPTDTLARLREAADAADRLLHSRIMRTPDLTPAQFVRLDSVADQLRMAVAAMLSSTAPAVPERCGFCEGCRQMAVQNGEHAIACRKERDRWGSCGCTMRTYPCTGQPAPAVETEPLPRYGIKWTGPTTPVVVPMPDGYWTPWHLAAKAQPSPASAEALRGLRDKLKFHADFLRKHGVSAASICATDLDCYAETVDKLLTSPGEGRAATADRRRTCSVCRQKFEPSAAPVAAQPEDGR